VNFNKFFISVPQFRHLNIKLKLKLTLSKFSFFFTMHNAFVFVESNNSYLGKHSQLRVCV
jgi:hypothetical protein